MSKREKVILIVMVLTIIGGGYTYFFSSPSETVVVNPSPGVDQLNRFMTDIAKNLGNKGLSENDTYIFTKAASEWAKDPFLESGLTVLPELSVSQDEVVVEEVHFSYSGYLNIGNRKLAIIDGMEYEAGEELDQGGYFVKDISPVQVVIGISGGNSEWTLPLEETD